MNAPIFCRPEAYELFATSLPALGTTQGLLQAALSVSLHALDDFDLRHVEQRLDSMVRRVLARARPTSSEALIAHLHHVLFEQERFVGERANYYSPLNSYLPAVLESRRGMPITLALIYKAVGERVGLEIDGVNAPGHFLVRVRDSRGWLLIDPFYRGVAWTHDEAYELIDNIFQRPIDRNYDLNVPATHAQWLERILLNLKSNFGRHGCRDDSAAMGELELLLSAALI